MHQFETHSLRITSDDGNYDELNLKERARSGPDEAAVARGGIKKARSGPYEAAVADGGRRVQIHQNSINPQVQIQEQVQNPTAQSSKVPASTSSTVAQVQNNPTQLEFDGVQVCCPEGSERFQMQVETSFEVPLEFKNGSDEGKGHEDPAPSFCTACGHDITTQECCQFKPKRARVASRVGERRQQEQRRAEEAASVRPRRIPNVSEATTPAQSILARMKQRLVGGPDST